MSSRFGWRPSSPWPDTRCGSIGSGFVAAMTFGTTSTVSCERVNQAGRRLQPPRVQARREAGIGHRRNRRQASRRPEFMIAIRADDVDWGDAAPEFVRGNILNAHPNWADWRHKRNSLSTDRTCILGGLRTPPLIKKIAQKWLISIDNTIIL